MTRKGLPIILLGRSPSLLTSRSSYSRLTYSTAASILQSPGRHPTAVPLSPPAVLQQSPTSRQHYRKVDDNNGYLFWRFKQSRLYFHPNVEIVILK